MQNQGEWSYTRYRIVRTAYEVGSLINNTLIDHFPVDLWEIRNQCIRAFEAGVRSETFPFPRADHGNVFDTHYFDRCVLCDQVDTEEEGITLNLQ